MGGGLVLKSTLDLSVELNAELCDALDVAIRQIDGWVTWKCPRQHRAEHDELLRQLRAKVAGGRQLVSEFQQL